MKELKLHWSAQPLSVLLSALMLLPILGLYLLGAPQARAQGLTATQPQWAVLDFANPSGYGGGDVGRLAADSFVVELAKINRYTVMPRQDVLNGIQADNLTPPLNLTSILRLGQSLGVSAVVAGEIGSISFSRDRRQAKVSLIVRVIDPRSGFLLNGALAEGLSNPRPIPVTDDEQLVNEAFGNAAFNAVKQISKFNLPVATVLLSGDTTLNGGQSSVTLNKGTRDGLYPNLDMLVTRHGVVTGRVRISQATNNDSNAVITDLGIGIKPEDRATAIYHLPNFTIDRSVGSFQTASNADVAIDTPSTGTHRSAFSGLGGILVALFTAGLVYAAVTAGHHGGDTSLGGAGTSGAQAIAGRAQDLGGSLTSIPIGSTISIPDYIPVAVRITSDIGNVNPTNFLEFHVYRSDSPPVLTNPFSLGVVPTFTTSTNNNNNGNNNGGNNNGGTGTTLGLAGFGAIPLLTQAGHSNLIVFDDLSNKVSVTASKPDPVDSSTLNTLTIQTLAVTVGGVTLNAGLPNTGLQFGQRVSYTIEGLYIQPSTFSTGTINPGTNTSGNNNNNNNNNNNGGNNNGGNNNGNTNTNTNGSNTTGTTGHAETFQLTGRRNTNSVTYIEPVHPAANAVSGTGASNVNVTVPATRGADDYILRISATDASVKSSYHQYAAAPGAYANSASPTTPTQGSPVVFNNVNLTTDFPGGTAYFYVIGARDSSNNGQHGFSNPYVFSDPLPLTTASGATPAIRFHGRKRS